MPGLQHGLAVPCFADEPAGLIEFGVQAERAGFDGFFLWDHMVFADSGEGPPIVDPWLVLAVVAARTSRIRIGTMVTPLPRRRPWQLARETATLDRLSGGRLILGVGIGGPAYAEFGIFHEPSPARHRAELLDEGLDIMTGLWSGERFSYRGRHFTVDPVRYGPGWPRAPDRGSPAAGSASEIGFGTSRVLPSPRWRPDDRADSRPARRAVPP